MLPSSVRPAASALGLWSTPSFCSLSFCGLLSCSLLSCGVDNRQVDVSMGMVQPGSTGAAGASAVAPLSAPGAAGSAPQGGAESSGAGGGGDGAGPASSNGSSTSNGTSNALIPCGNGLLDPAEACDDGNLLPGDGCTEDCLRVEQGFSCSQPGQACLAFARCGDGILAPSEQCDDGNTSDADGCSRRCRVELGKRCAGQPSICTDALCGNGTVEGSEACDDGNALPFDGCSARCEREPSCAGVSCQSTCGDGFPLGEQCDDGNLLDGDGCSADCRIELGNICAAEPSCELVAGQCTLRLPAIFRDFSNLEPDFGNNACNAHAPGAVGNGLDPTLRPVLIGGPALVEACLGATQNLATWFSDAPDRPTVAKELTLFDDGAGGHVNRFGPEGQQFQASAGGPSFDGTPLFFPLDDVSGPTAQLAAASIPVQYGVAAVTPEGALAPGAPGHNFAFTSEMHVPFVYNSVTQATLSISADDDVWVYLNGRLVLDLGGVHEPLLGAVNIVAALDTVTANVLDGEVASTMFSAANLGLIRGNIYRLSIFHAEREPPVSSLVLRLSGIAPTPSQCTAICGDGVLTSSEECDDGINAGGYGACQPNCVLGAFCGDRRVQVEFGETCDVGPEGSPTCRGCRTLPSE